jgi:hypothetical protein
VWERKAVLWMICDRILLVWEIKHDGCDLQMLQVSISSSINATCLKSSTK